MANKYYAKYLHTDERIVVSAFLRLLVEPIWHSRIFIPSLSPWARKWIFVRAFACLGVVPTTRTRAHKLSEGDYFSFFADQEA